ncbi:MAG: hypothetical protein RMK33_00175 [Arcobacter sp.]|nr:hypothetical protein [Bryobacteraceae bacterium]MDW8434563.1 hypothetical protein [Arcobacter sp.]
MPRQKSLRFLNPAGLRNEQYEAFFSVLQDIAPELVSDFWARCWPPVRDCEPGFEAVAAHNSADGWLRGVRLLGPDGAPPAWLRDNLALALETRAKMLRMYGDDPGERLFGLGASGVVTHDQIRRIFPAAMRMTYEFIVEPARGLAAEKKRILAAFARWLENRIAELAERGSQPAPSEDVERLAVKMWVAEWVRRTTGRRVEADERADRRTQALRQAAGGWLGLSLPPAGGRPRKGAKK